MFEWHELEPAVERAGAVPRRVGVSEQAPAHADQHVVAVALQPGRVGRFGIDRRRQPIPTETFRELVRRLTA